MAFQRIRSSPDLWRFVLAVPQAVIAVILLLDDAQRLFGIALIVDLVVVLLPWRIPRTTRSSWSFAAETGLYLAPLVVTAVAFAIARPDWVSPPTDLAPYVVGVVVGLYLVGLGGIPVAAVLDGSIADLLGTDKKGHCVSRGTQLLVAAPLEEATFRGALGVAVAPPITVLAAVTFVLRHHLVRGVPPPRLDKALYLRTTWAVLALGLVFVTQSLWTVVIAHFISNLPSAVVEFQRAGSAPRMEPRCPTPSTTRLASGWRRRSSTTTRPRSSSAEASSEVGVTRRAT